MQTNQLAPRHIFLSLFTVAIIYSACGSQPSSTTNDQRLLRIAKNGDALTDCAKKSEICAETFPPQCFTVCEDDAAVPGSDEPCDNQSICKDSDKTACAEVCIPKGTKPPKCLELTTLRTKDGRAAIGCSIDGSRPPEEKKPTETQPQKEATDISCEVDADCAVKNVGNCCGYYPKCVNVGFEPDLEAVKNNCAAKGVSSVCGFPSIKSCTCNKETKTCADVKEGVKI